MTEGRTSPVALVTGASRGLGAVVAGFLAQSGYDLVLVARHESPLRAVVGRAAGEGRVVLGIDGDVSDPATRRRIVETVARVGGLDLLINNASELGPSPLRSLETLSLDDLRRILEVNLIAPLALTQELLAPLVRSRGRVVNISSDAALGGYAGWGGYGASKAALDLVSKTWAAELRDRGVSVVAVDPGDLRTAMHQAAYPGEDISDRPLPDVTIPFWAWLLGQDPLRLSGHRLRAQAEAWELPA